MGEKKKPNTKPYHEKKKVTKGKSANSLAEYKDLGSDGSNNSVFGARRARPHASRLQHNTIRGPGAQRAGVRLSPRPGGERRAGREPGLFNAHHIRGEALGKGGKRRVRPWQRAAAPAPGPASSSSSELCGTAPASLSPPPAAPPTRPPGRSGTCGSPAGKERQSPVSGCPAAMAAPRDPRPTHPVASRDPARCPPCCGAARPAAMRRHVPAARRAAAPLAGTGASDTFNHLSTHLAWNSWLQGRTRRSCRASKSLKHTTHLGKGAVSTAPLHAAAPGPLPNNPPAPPGLTHRVCSDWWLSGLKR